MGRSYEGKKKKNARITDRRCYRANGYEEQYLRRSFHFKGSRSTRKRGGGWGPGTENDE